MGETTSPTEVTLPDNTSRRRGRRWSAKAFARTWREAKARLPDLRTMDLAVACDVTPATLYNWRKGQGKPGINEVLAIMDVLDCTMDDLTE